MNRGRQWLAVLVLFLVASTASAQTQFPLGGNGWMGLGNRNGDFFIVQDDLQVKVPGGYVRINRDFDGKQWVFNRQWSGLGRPSYNKAMYPSIGAFYSCTVVDGVSSCDTTASSGNSIQFGNPENDVQQTRIPNDPYFGRNADGSAASDPHADQFVARMGVGFTRSSDGTSWVSSKHPRFVLRPQQVPALPVSAGPDAHPSTGRPGKGGIATTQVNGFRWTDRSGAWIEYDNFGRITSYGDRNDVRVWMQYGSHGQVERVLDDNGRTVFTLLYTGGSADFVSEVRDHTPIDGSIRRVQYHYDGDGRLRNVIDARGNTTSFDYGSLDSIAYDYDGSFGAPGGGGSGEPINARAMTTSAATGFVVDTRRKVTKVTDAEGRVTEISYGVTARVGRIKAPDGGVTDFDYGYDKLKKEFSVTVRYPQTEGGRRIETFRFDQEGRPVLRETNGKVLMTASGSGRSLTYVDERNGTTQVQRDNFDEITKITYADGRSRTYGYEAGSTDVREFTDEAGTAWRYTWDDKGNLTEVRAAAGKPEEQVTEYVYNGRGEVELVRRKGGANADGSTDADVEVRLTHDDYGNVAEALDGEGKRWLYEYDSQGNVTRATDPLGHASKFAYDAHGNLLTEAGPNRNETRYTYDRTDRQATLTNGRDKTTQFGYDAAGRGITMRNPYGDTFADTYDQAGQLTSRSDASGGRSTLGYDNFGRMTKVVDGDSHQTLLDYTDGDGVDRGGRQPGKIAYPTFQRLFRYNERRRAIQQTELLGTDALVQNATHTATGQLNTLTNPEGHTFSYEYDALGRTVAMTDELGGVVRLAYDHSDNLIGVTNEKGHATRMSYDRRGLLISETNALGQVTRYTYDDAGKLSQIEQPSGTRVTHQYDPDGRLVGRASYRSDGSNESTQSISWDAADNLTGWSTDRASGVLTYDDADRLLNEAVSVDGVSLQRSYTYYPNDKVQTYTGPDGVTLTFSYNGSGELSRVEIPNEGTISVSEWNWNAPAKVVLPGGSVQELERDGMQGLTRLRVKGPGQTILFELENRFGKLRELAQRSADGKVTRFEYDEAVRLVKSEPAFIGGTSETYVIDAAGNREQHSMVSGTWEYDAVNRLIRRGEVSYDYDGTGNMTRKVDGGLAEPLRTTSYAYDAYNRLIEVRDGANDVIAAYAYDPFDNRLVKEIHKARNGAVVGKTLYLHGEEGLLAEVGADGTLLRGYGWHPEHDYATYPLFQRTTAGYFYYHNDHLGTPWRVTSREGAVVWSASDYTAFGTAKVAPGAQVVQPWRFPGQYLDVETGLHYNLRRYYEPDTGRYISEDPLRFDSAVNFYSYARHTPTNLTDPTGEILPVVGCLAWNYLRCVTACSVIDLAGQALTNPCDINVKDTIKDCLVDCLWDMLPIPNPCGRLGKWLAGAWGAANALGPPNSFTGETVVKTPTGDKRIDQLRPGDDVLAYAEWKDQTQVEKVTDLIFSHHEQTIVTLTLENGEQIRATGGHPLHTSKGWRAAQLLQAGGTLNVKGAKGNLVPRVITRVEQRKELVPVYNLEVSNAHTFFVGSNGVLAHNARSRTSGHNDAAAAGQRAHKDRSLGPPGAEMDVQLPNSRDRADFVDFRTRTIWEMKPCNSRAMKKGVRQVDRYVDQANAATDGPFAGGGWRGMVFGGY